MAPAGRKRKAEQVSSDEKDNETPERLTRRQERAAALQRARDNMAKDKAKVEAAKKKKAAEAHATPARTSSSSSKIEAAKTSTQKSPAPAASSPGSSTTSSKDSKQTPAKRRRFAQEHFSASPESKTPKGSSTSTKKQAREEAMQRAKQWGKNEKETLAKTKGKPTTAAANGAKTPSTKQDNESATTSSTANTQPMGRNVAPHPPTAAHQSTTTSSPANTQPMGGNVAPHPPTAAHHVMNQAAYNQSMINQMMMRGNMIQPMFANQYMMQQQSQSPYAPTGYAQGYVTQPFSPYGYSTINPYSQATGNTTAYQMPHQTTTPIQSQQPPVAVPPRSDKPSTPPTGAFPAAATATPPTTSSVVSATAIPDDDDDDDVVPPPPTSQLKYQISQQVMENCAASLNNQPLPHNQPPPEAFASENQQEEDNEVYDDEEDENPIVVDDLDESFQFAATGEIYSRKRRVVIVSAIVVALLAILVPVWNSASFISSGTKEDHAGKAAPCFVDSVLDENGNIVSSCGNEEAAPCPDHGICEGGVLVECGNEHYETSEYRELCVLTQKANESVATLRSLLEQLSIDYQCGSQLSTVNGGEDNSMPVFDYSDLKGEYPVVSMDLTLVETMFRVGKHMEGGYFVGLPADYELQLPFSCRMGKFFKGCLATCGSIVVIAAFGFIDLAWAFVCAYPITSLVILIILLVLKQRRSHQLYRSKLLRDIAHVRQMAYERLQASAQQAHVVLHIRDDITMSLYPDSKAQRHYIIQEVWPRVVPDVEQDNRVRKSTKLMDLNGSGNKRPRDVWQWVAAVPSSPTKTSRRTATATDSRDQ